MQTKLVLKNRFLAFLVLFCLIVQILGPSQIWSVLLVVLGGLFGLCLVWAYALRNGLELTREVRYGWAQVGDRLEERFILTNRSGLPAIWVEVIDLSDLPGHEISRAIGVEARSEVEWQVSSICERRGQYTLGPTQVRSGDPFGIFELEIINPTRQSIMIMPPVVALPKIDIAPGGIAGEARPRQNAHERTVTASGVREYSPGDSLRYIHWPTTARRQAYFVRLFDGTPAGDWRILVDLNQAVQRGFKSDASEEHAVILAASISDLGLRQKRVTSLTINGSPFTWLPGRSDESQRWEILRSLAMTGLSTTPLADLLKHLSPDLPSHTSLIIITADTSGDWLTGLFSLVWRGVTPTILLLDPLSFAPDQHLPAKFPLAETLRNELERHQIHTVIIRRDLLNKPQARPGHKGTWEWKISGSGRAFAISKPSDQTWKRLE